MPTPHTITSEWDKLAKDFNVHPAIRPFQKGNVAAWLEAILRTGNKRSQQEAVGIIFFFWWGICKERNRMVFEQQEVSFPKVVDLIKDAIIVYNRAFALDRS
jgi:hypothetical protein